MECYKNELWKTRERRDLLEIKNPIKEWKIGEEIPQKANKRKGEL